VLGLSLIAVRSPLASLGSSVASSPLSTTVSASGIATRLWNNNVERDQHENYASLYAIVKATESLEKAYTRDVISKTEYVFPLSVMCAHLITRVY